MTLCDLLQDALPELAVPGSPRSERADPSVRPSLAGLVSSLRASAGSRGMTQIAPSGSDTDLLAELGTRVAQLSTTTLSPEDARLAETLVGLLAHFERLSVLDRALAPPAADGPARWSPIEPPPPGDLFDTLRRQVSDLQVERLYSADGPATPGAPPVVAVESALIWSKIDAQLETVLALSRQRTDAASASLPPEYEPGAYDGEHPPLYEHDGKEDYVYVDEEAREPSVVQGSATDISEKMRMDLDAVTAAIDRLYVVCPQLHSQRVELKDPKRRELEKARTAPPRAHAERDDVNELEKILGLIGRASERKLVDQAVVLEGGSMETRLNRAKARDLEKVRLYGRVNDHRSNGLQRHTFTAQLAEYSDAGRIHAQDAELRPPREKDPEAMLSLPEFIREGIPASPPKNTEDQSTSSPPAVARKSKEHQRSLSASSSRSRSYSAPPLAWLLSAGSRSSTPGPDGKPISAKARGKRPDSSGGPKSAPLPSKVSC